MTISSSSSGSTPGPAPAPAPAPTPPVPADTTNATNATTMNTKKTKATTRKSNYTPPSPLSNSEMTSATASTTNTTNEYNAFATTATVAAALPQSELVDPTRAPPQPHTPKRVSMSLPTPSHSNKKARPEREEVPLVPTPPQSLPPPPPPPPQQPPVPTVSSSSAPATTTTTMVPQIHSSPPGAEPPTLSASASGSGSGSSPLWLSTPPGRPNRLPRQPSDDNINERSFTAPTTHHHHHRSVAQYSNVVAAADGEAHTHTQAQPQSSTATTTIANHEQEVSWVPPGDMIDNDNDDEKQEEQEETPPEIKSRRLVVPLLHGSLTAGKQQRVNNFKHHVCSDHDEYNNDDNDDDAIGTKIRKEQNDLSRLPFTVRFLNDINHLKKLLEGETVSNKGKKRFSTIKPKEASVPVFNTLMIKRMVEIDEHLFLQSTLVQRAFGLCPNIDDEGDDGENNQEVEKFIGEVGNVSSSRLSIVNDEKADDDTEEAEIPFSYRFNDQSPHDGELELRRVEYHAIPLEGQRISVSRFTFNAMIPMTVDSEFDQFPFTVFRGQATIELSTRNDIKGKNLRLRPNLILHQSDRRNNVGIQKPKKLLKDKYAKIDPPEDKLMAATIQKLDASDTYGMITPYPEVSYEYQPDKKYCPRYNVAFYLSEDAIPKFIRIQLPMLLVATLNTINYLIALREVIRNNNDDNGNDANATTASSAMSGGVVDDDDEAFVSSSDRYLQTSAALGLTAVFVLPEMARRRNVSIAVTWNEYSVLLIFFSLAVSSIPPSFVDHRISLVGVVLLWVTFVIPFYNLYRYYMYCTEKRMQRDFTVSQSKDGNHPFVHTGTFKRTGEDEKLFRSMVYVEDGSKVGRCSKGYIPFLSSRLLNYGGSSEIELKVPTVSNY